MHFENKNLQKRRLILIVSLLFCVFLNGYSQSSKIALTFSQGHLGKVTSLAISKDAKLIISAGDDKKIKVWDVEQERLLRTIPAHDIGISDIALSVNNEYIVSSGLDHTVKVWETKTGNLLAQQVQLPDAVQEVSFQKNVVIFIDAQGNIYHWDWSNPNGGLKAWSQEITGGVSCFITRPKSNSWVAFGKFDGSIEIWNAQTKKLKSSKKLYKDWVTDLIYIHKKKVLISGGWDGTMRLWNVQSDSISDPIYLPDGNAVRSITYSHIVDKIVVTSYGNHAYYYKTDGKTLILDSKFEKREIVTTSFNRKGELAVVAYKNGEISLWDMKDLKLKASWRPIQDKAIGVAASLTSNSIAVSSEKGYVRYWESGSRSDLKKWKAHNKEISSIIYQLRGNLITSSKDSTIKIWDHSNKYTLKEERKFKYPIEKALLLPDDSTLVFMNNGGDIYITNVDNADSTQKIFSSFNPISAITLSFDGTKIAFTQKDRTLRVLDIRNDFEEILKTKISDRYLNSLSFNLPGSHLLIGGKNKLQLLNVLNNEIEKSIPIDKAIKTTSFTYDNESVIVAFEEGGLYKYTADLSKEVFHYEESKGDIVEAFDFPGKQVFVTLSTDFAVGIWDLESPYRFGAVLSDGDVGWVVEHYSGLFDASETNMNNLYYVVGNETIDLNQLRGMYWEPGLGTKLFTGGELREVPPLSSVALFPEANVYKKNDKLYVEVFDRGGGVGNVAVLVNGKEVLDDISPYKIAISVNNLNLFNQKEQTQKFIIPMDTLSYLFQNGETYNNITVRVENEQGTLSGRGLTIRHKTKNEQKEIPSFYGIVIGVSDYRGTTLDLKYAANDAEKIAASIKESAEELFGEYRVKVDLFSTNSKDPLFQPTKQNIKRSFDSLQHIATPSDVLFVFLAGHGMAVKELNGEEDFYYLTKDMLTADLSDPSIKENYTIAGKEWLEWMKKIPITRQVFIMDACNAGKFAETIVAMRSVDDEAVRLRALERVRNRSGMYLLAGSAADKVSYESTMYGQGLLTYALLDYLKRGSLRKGEFLDVQLMFGNAVDEVPRLAERFGAMQQPEMRIPEGGDSFDIGRVTDDIKKNINISTALARITSSMIEEDSSWVDSVGLSKDIDLGLLRLSEGLNSGFNYFTFSPFSKGSDVYQVRGRYILVEDEIQLKIRILKGKDQLYEKDYQSTDKDKMVENILIDVVNFFKDL